MKYRKYWGFPGGAGIKTLPANAGGTKRHEFNPCVGKDHPEKEMATHSNILAWEIPLTEVPSGLHSMGSQRVGHDLTTA